MALDSVPYEIKRLIYDYADLQTIKDLRQVSKSWASVGLNYLLLPGFNIKSSNDVDRLSSISTSDRVAQYAAKTVKCLIFQSRGWDPRYFRSIVCSRHELRQGYETIDFVPTQAEQAALDELDGVIKQKDIDSRREEDLSGFISALKSVPGIATVKIASQNPFAHPILRKSWEEYDLEAFKLHQPQYTQLENIFSRLSIEAGLSIQNLTHERLLSEFFTRPMTHLHPGMKNLRSLNLVISDLSGMFTSGPESIVAHSRLQQLICNSPCLQSLTISFEVLGTVPTNFLDLMLDINTCTLHTLSLSGITLSPSPFFTFLTPQSQTLKYLRLGVADLPIGYTSWRKFLEEVRDRFGSTLEKFQIFGMLKHTENEDANWLLFPIYDAEWKPVKSIRNGRTKELEDFVLRGGHWPMLPSDSFPLT